MQKATCQWKKLRGGGLADFQHKSIYRSQKLRTDMGSMQQVLFRFQLQPFVINWLLSSTANQGTALIKGHTHRWTDTPRNTTINRLCHSGSVCVCVCVYTQTSTGAKPFKCVWSMPTWPESRICIISCSVVWIDRRIKWLVKESFMLLFSFSPHTKPCSIDCKDTHFSLNVCLCDLSLILRYATGTSWRSSQVSVAFYGDLLWFFCSIVYYVVLSFPFEKTRFYWILYFWNFYQYIKFQHSFFHPLSVDSG